MYITFQFYHLSYTVNAVNSTSNMQLLRFKSKLNRDVDYDNKITQTT